MTKIAFIGAGSVVFTRDLLGDLYSFPELRGAHVALHDIDAGRLATAEAMARRTAEVLGVPEAHITAHLDRRAALDGANYVMNMVQVGMHDATLADFDIPRRYGLRQTIADTTGIGGIFRFLRTAPLLHGLAVDIHEVAAPGAWLLNYTNPMAMNCWYVYEGAPLQNVVGLCHSVQHTTHDLAALMGLPASEVDVLAAGVNHQAFLLRFEHKGEDLYPRLDERIASDPDLQRRVRVELYRRFGYFPTESSEHASEYLPWFLRHDDQIEHFRIPVDEYVRRSANNLERYEKIRIALAAGDPFAVNQSLEYAVQIVHSIETGTPRVIYGNVRNDDLITNLPAGACVEVPCLVDRLGVQPTRVGNLPPQLAALNRGFLNVVELAVRAAIDGDPAQIRRAAMLDGNVSATLTIDQIWSMCNDLVAAHGDALPEPLRVLL